MFNKQEVKIIRDEESQVGFNKEQIKAIEDHYKASFVGDFCIKAKGGGWVNMPVAIFYQENPPELSSQGRKCSNYFGMYYAAGGDLMICDGSSAFAEPIAGVVADNGEVIYSRWRHDYRGSSDGYAIVDGGRDYLKTNRANKTVQLVIDRDKLVILE